MKASLVTYDVRKLHINSVLKIVKMSTSEVAQNGNGPKIWSHKILEINVSMIKAFLYLYNFFFKDF
jgi:hypothetical protein